MPAGLAILAFGGGLPPLLVEQHPSAHVITFEGFDTAVTPTQTLQFEKLQSMFDYLRAENVNRVVFAGALSRPKLNPAAFDPLMLSIAPRLMAALEGGDDTLLRTVISIFEEQDVTVVGVHELLHDITMSAGVHLGEMDAQASSDATRAFEILNHLSTIDVGQGCAVAGGQCLGIETVQGTDALLDYIGQTEPHLKRGAAGVYVKSAKKGQDLRVDMPVIGPDTIKAVADAGLGGIAIGAGVVMVLEPKKTLQMAQEAGLFLAAWDVR